MSIKFDIGEIVLIPAKVCHIEITQEGITYQVFANNVLSGTCKFLVTEKYLVPADEIKDDINTYVARR